MASGGLSGTARAVTSQGWSDAVFFYRSPQSIFPSGQAPRRELEFREQKNILDLSFGIRWNESSFRVNAEQILRDLQTSTWVKTRTQVDLGENPQQESQIIKTLSSQTSLRVLNVLNHWASVFDGQHQGWIPLHHLTQVREDRGLFVALLDSYLRSVPQQGAPILSTARKGSRWLPVRILDEWLEVSWEGQKAYLDLAHLAHRIDFSIWAYHQELGWLQVSSRASGVVYGVNRDKYLLKDFIAFETDPKKAIMIDSIPQGPQLRSRVQLESVNAVRWTQSQLPGHGEVWWKTELSPVSSKKSTLTFSFQELIKKSIYSLSFVGGTPSPKAGEPPLPLHGLAASQGVFRTHDGRTWEKIEEFENENLPVCIHPEGVWFVGSFRSFDQGMTFEPFLRWDLVAELVQSELHRPPLYLRLTKIKALSFSQLELQIDTGFRKVRLRGHTLGQSWQIAK